MAKRLATTELNRDNWDEDDEPEEAGHYAFASEKEMQNRVIKKAKRSIPKVDEERKSAFSGFGGFGKSAKFPLSGSGTDASGIFKHNGCNQSISNKFEAESQSGKETMKRLNPSDFSNTDVRDSAYYQHLKNLNESFIEWLQTFMNRNPFCNFSPVCQDYLEHVSKLDNMFPSPNSAPSSSVQNSSTPFKIPNLSPVKSTSSFVDSSSDHIAKSGFANFLKNQQELKPKSPSSKDDEMSYGAGFKSNTTNTSTISYTHKMAHTETSTGSPVGPSFSQGCLGKSKNENKDNDKQPSATEKNTTSQSFNFQFKPNPSFTFGQDNKSEGFSFGSDNKTETFRFGVASPASKGFSFGTSNSAAETGDNKEPFKIVAPSVNTNKFSFATKPTTTTETEAEDDEYVPPKNESVAIVEDDAFYTKRCKVFFKDNDNFKERGIGLLYLKPHGDKTILLIRNDTVIGTILLNIVLSSVMPIARSGKNNVLLTCIPNPPLDPSKPDSKESIPVLIRVKTSEDADELLTILKEHQS